MQKSNFVMVDDGEYKEITIDPDKPRTVFTAVPLITCFGVLLTWNDKTNQKAILYHAPSAVLEIDKLEEFTSRIMKDKYPLENVNIVIACSEPLKKVGDALNDCLMNLRAAGLVKDPIVKENQHAYSMDSLGNHGETLSAKMKAKEAPTSTPSSSPGLKR